MSGWRMRKSSYMADWKMKQTASMDSSRDAGLIPDLDSSIEQDVDSSLEQDPVATPTTLDDFFKAPKPKDPTGSPTTPLAFGTHRRQSFYSHSHSINGKIPKPYDPTDGPTTPTTPTSPSTFGNPARRSTSYARSQSMNTRVIQLNDPIANSSSLLAFGNPGRTSSPYARSQSMNGRIQKPSFGRSQSFGGSKGARLGQRSHQMDTLQSQLYNNMRTLGVDHHKVVHWLERLKELYLNRGEQAHQQENYTNSTPDSPLAGTNQPSRLVDDPPVQGSIALLKHKFAQLERFKESTQGQQIPLYPNQNYYGGSLSAGQRSTPTSPSPGSPPVAPSPDTSYEFDQTTAALLALQQEMMWSSPRSSTSGASESVRSRSPNWYSASNSPCSSIGSRGDEAANVMPSYHKLRPLNVGRQSSLGAFQDSSQRGAATGNTGHGDRTDSLAGLFLAEKMESLAAIKVTDSSQKTSASSIETAMAKLSFSLAPKLSSPRRKIRGTWGTGLTLNTQGVKGRSGGRLRGREMPGTAPNVSAMRSSYSGVKCPDDIRMEHQEHIDTSLRL